MDGGLVLARSDVHGLFLLNPAAELLWSERLRGASEFEVAQVFHSVLNVPLEVAESDIERTLAQWSTSLLAERGHECPRLLAPPPSPQAITLDCRLAGTSFSISVDPGELVEEIGPRLAHLSASTPTPDFTFHVTQCNGRVFVTLHGTCIGDEELSSGARVILFQEMICLCKPDRVAQAMLHAGACGSESACILLAGSTHSGKSTLCAALMSAGLLCYSDDTAIIDGDHLVAGMPFPLMLREGSWSVIESHFPQLQQAPVYNRWGVDVRFLASNLPANSSPSVPAKALLFVEYLPGSASLLEPISTFDALVAFEQSGFWVEHQRESIESFLQWLGELPKYRFTYSDLDSATNIFRSLLEMPQDAPPLN